jgi:hypothetical protein
LEQSCSGRKGIQCVRQGWQCKLSVVSTSKELHTGRSTADIFHSIEHNEINNRSSYCWHEIWPGGLWPPWASPAPMLRRRPSSGTGTQLRAPVVILGFAEYGLFSVYKSSVFLILYR